MASDTLIEQFIFDYYVKKCLDSAVNEDWLSMEEPKNVLTALLTNKSIDPVVNDNTMKANLTSVTFTIKDLMGWGLQNWTHVADIKQSTDLSNVLESLDDMQCSLEAVSESPAGATLRELSRESMFYICVLMAAIFSHRMMEKDVEAGERVELETGRNTVLNKLTQIMDGASNNEKKLIQTCELLLVKPSLHKTLPTPSDVRFIIEKVLAEASKVVVPINTCFCGRPMVEGQTHRDGRRRQKESLVVDKELMILLTDTRPSRSEDLFAIAGVEPDDPDLGSKFKSLKRKVEQIRLARQSLGEPSARNRLLQQVSNRKQSNVSPNSASRQLVVNSPVKRQKPARQRRRVGSSSSVSSPEKSASDSSVHDLESPSKKRKQMDAPMSVESSGKSPQESPPSSPEKPAQNSPARNKFQSRRRKRLQIDSALSVASPQSSAKKSHRSASASTGEGSNTSMNSSPYFRNNTNEIQVSHRFRAKRSLIEFSAQRKPPSHTAAHVGKWTPREEEEFIKSVITLGEGNWQEIRTAIKSVRSNVQLKDKWRNISIQRVKAVAKQHNLVYKGSKQ